MLKNCGYFWLNFTEKGLHNPKPDKTIKRKGYATWFEYHFGSGQGHNNGRIYSVKGNDGKYRVLIGLKETQDEDIKELMDIPLQ